MNPRGSIRFKPVMYAWRILIIDKLYSLIYAHVDVFAGVKIRWMYAYCQSLNSLWALLRECVVPPWVVYIGIQFNALRSSQNGCNVAEYIFKCIFITTFEFVTKVHWKIFRLVWTWDGSIYWRLYASLGLIINNTFMWVWINDGRYCWIHFVIALRPRQNDRHFAAGTFKRIFLNENVCTEVQT